MLNNETSCCREELVDFESLCTCGSALSGIWSWSLGWCGAPSSVLVFQTGENLNSSRRSHHNPRKNVLSQLTKKPAEKSRDKLSVSLCEGKKPGELEKTASYQSFEHCCRKNSTAPPSFQLKATGLVPVHKANHRGYRTTESPQDKYVWSPFWSKRIC